MANRTQIRFSQISGSLPGNSANAFEIKHKYAGAAGGEKSLIKFITLTDQEGVSFQSDINVGAAIGMSPGGTMDWQRVTTLKGRGASPYSHSPLTGTIGNLDNALITAAAVKTYVDTQVTAADLDFQADNPGTLSIDLDSEVLDIAGGQGLATTGSVNEVSVGLAINTLSAGMDGDGTVELNSDQMVIWDNSNVNHKKLSFSQVSNAIFGQFSGDATVGNGGALTIAAASVEGSMIHQTAISGQTEMTGDVADADELMISDGGALKRADFSVIRDAVFNDVSGDAGIASGGALTIAAAAVEHAMLAEDAVEADNIANNAILTAHISDDQVIADHLANSINAEIALGVAALPKSGGAMTGAITTNSTFDGVDVATRDGILSSTTVTANAALSRGGGTMTGHIVLTADPTLALHPASKGYVDALKQGLSSKDSVRVAPNAAFGSGYAFSGGVWTEASGTGALTVDSVVLVTGDRVLLKHQDNDETVHLQNGIYTVAGIDGSSVVTLTRSLDLNSSAEAQSGAYFFVEEGTNSDSGWVLTTDGAITLNTTAIAFTQFSGAGAITAGYGLVKAGSDMALELSELTAEVLATGDFIPFVDSDGGSHKEDIADIATLFAGAGLTAASSVLSVDAAQSAITSLGTLTALQVDNIGLDGNAIAASSGALSVTAAAGSAVTVEGVVMDGGVVTGPSSITSTAFVGALTGNASTATILATARTIGGTSFDGSANITPANATLAAGATVLATARTINGVSFDGSANITVTAAGSTLSDTVTVAKGGTGQTTLDDIVLGTHSDAGTFLSVTGGADAVIGGNVTLSLSDYVESLHDQLVAVEAAGSWVAGSSGMLKVLKAGDDTTSLMAMEQHRDIYERTATLAAGTGLALTNHIFHPISGAAQNSATDVTDSNRMAKVYVNGQLLREGQRSGGGIAAGSFGDSGDYVFYHVSSAGSEIVFGFALERGDIVQVVLN